MKLLAPWISIPSYPAFKEISLALAKSLIILSISSSLNSLNLFSSLNIPLSFNSLLETSAQTALTGTLSISY